MERDVCDGEAEWAGLGTSGEEDAVDVVAIGSVEFAEGDDDFFPVWTGSEILLGGHVSGGLREEHDAAGAAIAANPEVQRFFRREISGGEGRGARRKHRSRPGVGEGIRDGAGDLQRVFAAAGAAFDDFKVSGGFAAGEGICGDGKAGAEFCIERAVFEITDEALLGAGGRSGRDRLARRRVRARRWPRTKLPRA